MKKKSNEFVDSLLVNDLTYMDYLERFKKIATSIFEWVNLPESMDSRYIERCLYYDGKCAFLKDKKYGFINTRVAGAGPLNIYGLPSTLNCYSYEYSSQRKLYTGLKPISEDMRKYLENSEAILVMNNADRIPTYGTMNLFALRLYEAERTIDVNIKAQKTPIFLKVPEKQRLTLKNLYLQYDGNQPFIFGDNQNLNVSDIQAITTQAPIVFDKVTDYKKEIWNEALTFLGVNNLSQTGKKERLISGESSENNEVINYNLQSYLIYRKQACREFNKKFGLEGTGNEIDVRIRSDLENIIKTEESIVKDYKTEESTTNESEVEKDVRE